ncbi:DUF1501 domain-containing protein [Schlesneria paludicola]|uniref:DUF1501 domain-containing protein n=1 Tax=Schlesneria paludicola TaxID=360056 RepID=UPI00029AE740|nr:DUF1501 domain-containing protein [Schlesneria paludicola]
MLEILGRPQTACGGIGRRELLQAGGAGLFGLNLPKVLQAESLASGSTPRAKNIIFLLLFGGPSQLETFDLKPDAPSTIRGPYSPIASRTPDLRICEKLPHCAAISDKFAVVRTMSHAFNDHSVGSHYIQTGKRWHIPIGGGFNATPQDWPSMGSVVEYLTQNPHLQHAISRNSTSGMPNYVVLPNSLGRLQTFSVQLRRPGEYAGWLGRGYDPVTTAIDKKDNNDNPYIRACTDQELTFQIDGLVSHESLTLDRMNRRRSLLDQFDQQRQRSENEKVLSAYDRFQQRALALVSSERTRQALDLRQESATTRDRYGRHLFGQSTLMARRLIEEGVRFVTVHWDAPDGYGWDSHINSKEVGDHLLPGLDQTLSALIVDLEERGMLDDTLVVCLGEMGRTPKGNANWGRDHWSTLFPAVLAGAGIRGGTVLGQSDKDAAYAVTPPHSPDDLAATLYDALGIDPELRLPDAQGRPVALVEDGHPIRELFG